MSRFLIGCSWLLFFVVSEAKTIDFEVFLLEDQNSNSDFKEILASKSFKKVEDIHSLNFGISSSTKWLRVQARNLDRTQKYRLKIASVTPDSIAVFEKNGKSYFQTWIGEGVRSQKRFNVYDIRSQNGEFIVYLKVICNGQPIALPLSIVSQDETELGEPALFLVGIIYGIIALILTLNLILYISTFDVFYLYAFTFNSFATAVLLYFDGFIKLFFIPDSLYWNNQFAAISLCGSFIITNFYIPKLLNIYVHSKVYKTLFTFSTILFLIILALSFWHPTGFQWYVKLNIILLSAEAILLFFAVLYVRKKEKDFFFIEILSISFLIFFGNICQFYFLGLLPIFFLTQYCIYFMILPQIFFQTLALSKRLYGIIQERYKFQELLLKMSEEYSQSLIITLENERKRISSEFHDGIGQSLLVIRNQILLMLKRHKLTPIQVEKLNNLATVSSDTLDEIRTIAQNLRPASLDSLGLTLAIKHMAEKMLTSTSIRIDFTCSQNIDGVLPVNMDINFYRIIQELFNNLIKHSQAQQAKVSIGKEANQMLYVKFEDDGIGFDVNKINTTGLGHGLSGIKERVRILNGTISIDSEIGNGTSISIYIPITTIYEK